MATPTLEHIAIVGLGSVGSFLAKCLTSLNTVKKLTFIDHDIVEEKNLSKSIYRKLDVGKYKVNAAKEIIEASSDIYVQSVPEKYNKHTFSSDLIIDCRDTTEKDKNIQCKLSVSGRSVILDCMPENNSKIINGFYTEKVNKSDLQLALSNVSSLISTSLFPHFIKKQLTYIVNMNDNSQKAFEVIKNNNEKKLIEPLESKVYGFQYIADNIIATNTQYAITIYRMDNPLMKIKLNKGEITNKEMLCSRINSIIFMNEYNFFPNFIDKNHIELIPEIGAA